MKSKKGYGKTGIGKNVMVVDDDLGILEACKIVLEDEGFKVITAADPKEVIGTVNEKQPGLIFLDILLSGEDGRDICRKLKANETTSHIPVIMVSAVPHLENSLQKCDADGFLVKPFEIDELLGLARKYMGKNG